MNTQAETEIRALYQRVIEGWNQRSAEAMAAPYAEDGEQIGYDGSQVAGRDNIAAHLQPIFEHHRTPAYVTKVRGVRFLSDDVADLRAIAGLVPHGQTEIQSALNSLHTMIAIKREGEWRVALFQNTPAQFHGRPELVEAMTAELRAVQV